MWYVYTWLGNIASLYANSFVYSGLLKRTESLICDRDGAVVVIKSIYLSNPPCFLSKRESGHAEVCRLKIAEI